MSTQVKKLAAAALALSIAFVAGGAAYASPYGEKGEKKEEKVEYKESKGKKSLEVHGKSASKNATLSYTVNPGNITGTVKTDKQGNYEFSVKVAAGNYTVSVAGGQTSVITVK